jgi:HEPN domain-containing protein
LRRLTAFVSWTQLRHSGGYAFLSALLTALKSAPRGGPTTMRRSTSTASSPRWYTTASIYRRLVAEAERRGAAVDEVAVELLEAALGASLDPPERAEFHRSLAEKFLREAEELLARGDYVQASEKAWGAAAQIVKAVAAKKGKELRSHGDLWRFVNEIAGEDRELRRLWRTANSLHQNFYEGWMPPEDVKYAVEDVKQFVERLKKML